MILETVFCSNVLETPVAAWNGRKVVKWNIRRRRIWDPPSAKVEAQ